MNQQIHLSFSIGPVQTFVAQARRTRDLWAGSWLLSYLAESALVAVEKLAVEKQFPDANTIIPDRSQNRGELTSIKNANGGIPNRFEVAFDSKGDAVAAGEAAVNGFQRAWKSIAQEVHKVVLPSLDQGNDSQAIWDRQVKHFWDLNWIVAEPEPGKSTIGEAAAARKLFRNVNVSANGESGVKCSLMPELQELSGHSHAEEQNAFWAAVAACQDVRKLDIRTGERLSAIALIKRLFPNIDERILGESLNQESWPSTAFFAATPWLSEIDQNAAAKKLAIDYVRTAEHTEIRSSELDLKQARFGVN